MALEDTIRRIQKILEHIKSPRLDEYVLDTLKLLGEGKIKLTTDEFFRFWADLSIGEEIIFYRCTSRINPKLWRTAAMILYWERQLEDIKKYYEKTEREKRRIEQIIASFFPKYEEKNNFERIFLITDSMRVDPEILRTLVDLISKQKEFVDIKIICIDEKERPTPQRPQDFGIILTEKGDSLLMDVELSPRGEVGGGKVIFDPETVTKYLNMYEQISQRAVKISKSDTPDQIREKILFLTPTFLFPNRCLMCLKDAEDRVRDGTWRYEKSAKKYWYEVVYDESEILKEILLKYRPKRIIEMGTGPGRVVQLILDTYSARKIPYEQIVGIEQNYEIYQEAFNRFVLQSPRVIIIHGMISESKERDPLTPYPDKFFDLATAVENFIGWQINEIEMMKRLLKVTKMLFFTVYKKEVTPFRIKFYEAAGDEVQIKNGQVWLMDVDAFGRTPHCSKCYEREEIKNLLNQIAKELPITVELFDVGKYLFGGLIKWKK
jgi:hypothetical protein